MLKKIFPILIISLMLLMTGCVTYTAQGEAPITEKGPDAERHAIKLAKQRAIRNLILQTHGLDIDDKNVKGRFTIEEGKRNCILYRSDQVIQEGGYSTMPRKRYKKTVRFFNYTYIGYSPDDFSKILVKVESR